MNRGIFLVLVMLFLGAPISVSAQNIPPVPEPTVVPIVPAAAPSPVLSLPSPSPSPQQTPSNLVPRTALPPTLPDDPYAASEYYHVPTVEEKAKWQAEWLQIDWEREKLEKKIVTDTVVIHETDGVPGATWQSLSELQFRLLYVPVYNDEKANDPYVKGLQVHSGHYRHNDRGELVEIFYAYHALVKTNGSIEPLLPLTEVGWHAGRWAENMKSVGIVLDGEYSKGLDPNEKMLQALVAQILEWKKTLPLKYLKGHKEINKKNTCPGTWWDAKDKDGKTGRQKLAELTGLQLVE